MAKITVIGSGAWGTALALVAQRAGHDVLMWAREEDVVSSINTQHTNRFLPQIVLPDTIHATSQLSEAVSFADMVFLVTPAQYTRQTIQSLKPMWRDEIPLVLCAKGIELTSGLLLTEVVAQELPQAKIAVLSGPGFAAEVAKENPTATTIASADKDLARQLVSMMGGNRFRPYYTTDIVSPEVCGALKNVIAIAAGVIDGCGYGDNCRAALITRGLSEMARFAKALGGHYSTVLGMSGVGDLVLTCCSSQSRNYSFGYQLGQAGHAQEVLSGMTATVEGVPTALAVMKRARAMGVDMPICEAVEVALTQDRAVSDILHDLFNRPYKNEVDDVLFA